MTREEIEKLPGIVDTMLGESVTEHVEEKLHEKITEVCNLAIKVLEQEPCEDAISRAAAIKTMDDLEQEDIELYGCPIPEGFDGKRAIDALQKLPSVTPKQKMGRWIPVSERLPETFSFVNCTCHSLIDDREDWVVETCYLPQPPNSPYSDWGNIPMLNWGECEVIAWMYRDIPEPYKAESEDRNGTD